MDHFTECNVKTRPQGPHILQTLIKSEMGRKKEREQWVSTLTDDNMSLYLNHKKNPESFRPARYVERRKNTNLFLFLFLFYFSLIQIILEFSPPCSMPPRLQEIDIHTAVVWMPVIRLLSGVRRNLGKKREPVATDCS